jgi:hypothetical protein
VLVDSHLSKGNLQYYCRAGASQGVRGAQICSLTGTVHERPLYSRCTVVHTPRSCAVVYKIHPPFQRYPTLSPQLLRGIPQRLRRPLIICQWYDISFSKRVRVREHGFVKRLGHVPSVDIGHLPHRPNDSPEPVMLHRGGKVEHLVSDALLCQPRRTAGGEGGEFCVGKLRPGHVEQREALPVIKLERPPWFKDRVACEMGKPMRPEMFQRCGRCRPW